MKPQQSGWKKQPKAVWIAGGVLLWIALMAIGTHVFGSRNTCRPGTPASSFLIGFVGHSGSTAIMSSMSRHPDLRIPFPYEPLLNLEDDDPVAALEVGERILKDGISNQTIPGFKIRPEAFDHEGWQDVITRYKVRLIINYRNNVFKNAIGQYAIRKLGIYSAQQGINGDLDEHCEKNPDLCRFEIDDLEYFSYLMNRAHRAREAVRSIPLKLNWPCVMVNRYESFLAHPEHEMNRIYEFLGVEPVRYESWYQKGLPDNPCEVLKNYQDVCKKFYVCEEFREYLEDPESGCLCKDRPSPPFKRTDLCTVLSVEKTHKQLCDFVTAHGKERLVECSSLDDLMFEKYRLLMRWARDGDRGAEAKLKRFKEELEEKGLLERLEAERVAWEKAKQEALGDLPPP